MEKSEASENIVPIMIEGVGGTERSQESTPRLSPMESRAVVSKTPLGIPELDRVLYGGFPVRSLILLSGNAGSGKTILSTQFLFNGATKYSEKGVYVSFAENSDDYFRSMVQLRMDMKELQERGMFRFLDLVTIAGEDALNVILEKILQTVSDLGAKRLVIDSLSALLQTLGQAQARIFLHSILGKLVKSMGITTLLIGEIPYGETKTGFGVEEFVVDGVILLKRSRAGLAEKKEMEITKMRGVPLERTVFEYLISERYGGIVIISLPMSGETQFALTERITSGIERLDKMLGGGLFRGSITVIEGPSGVGKTTSCLQFVAANAEKGERSLYVTLEEPKQQIVRLMENYGMDHKKYADRLFVEALVPEAVTPLHFFKLLDEVGETYKPSVLALESLTSIQQVLTEDDFLVFSRYAQLSCKKAGLTVLVTSTSGSSSERTRSGISTLADNLISMRYSEVKHRVTKEMVIVKVRGSPHEKRVIPFEITNRGIVVHA